MDYVLTLDWWHWYWWIWKTHFELSNCLTMNGRSCSMSHRTSGTPHGPGMINGQQIPPIRVQAGTPCPSLNSSTPSPAIGNLSSSLHLKMPLGGGVAPQSNITDGTIHLPALSPRRQVVTNGKPLFQVPQTPGLPAPQSLKPKQQEYGNNSTSTVKGRINFLMLLKIPFFYDPSFSCYHMRISIDFRV